MLLLLCTKCCTEVGYQKKVGTLYHYFKYFEFDRNSISVMD